MKKVVIAKTFDAVIPDAIESVAERIASFQSKICNANQKACLKHSKFLLDRTNEVRVGPQ